ncbi:cytochrome P450 [Aspergillus foveolatus]|uniref:cytochrome P450 n=1 Tax=Aspergillus foveolatus TaxID=210207 RepID=UPI003CCE4910
MAWEKIFCATALGILAHILVFIRGEWHLRAPAVVVVHVAVLAILAFTSPWAQTCQWTACYLVGLFASITIYRAFFHRARNFPGPRLAAISKLWSVYQCLDYRNHEFLESLHKHYGSFVRSGPAEITVFHPAAWDALDGPDNHNTRSDWYDLIHPRVSPILSRTSKDHIERRRPWSKALSTKAITQYIPRILSQIDALDAAICRANGAPIVLNDIMLWFSFDAMGEFAFDKSFGMLKDGAWHRAVIQQRSALGLLGSLSHTVWAIRLAFAFLARFWRVKDWMDMMAFCDRQMQRRLETQRARVKHQKPSPVDIAAYFIEEYEAGRSQENEGEKWKLLSGNAISVIVGGREVSSLFLLICYRFLDLVKTLSDPTDITKLARLPILNGFINETMRIMPGALTFGSRVTPTEGLMIGGTHIPGGIKVVAPKYSLYRLPSVFESPLSFIPERWYSRPELIRDKTVFAPFGVGRRVCVGKNLAITQVRLVAAILLLRYRVGFAPGETGDAFERDLRDQLTAQPGRCRVVFERR